MLPARGDDADVLGPAGSLPTTACACSAGVPCTMVPSPARGTHLPCWLAPGRQRPADLLVLGGEQLPKLELHLTQEVLQEGQGDDCGGGAAQRHVLVCAHWQAA